MAKAGLLGLLRKRHLMIIAAIALLSAAVLLGTVAWLVYETLPVTNTIGFGDVRVRLDETDTRLDGDSDPMTNTYEMMPGRAITKDPRVTVLSGSQDCWLFLCLEKSGAFDTLMTFELAQDDSGQPLWTPLNGVENVYWRSVDQAETDSVFPVFRDDRVVMRPDVTPEILRELGTGETLPRLSIQGFAVQRDGGIPALASAEAAWRTLLDQASLDER